MIAPQLIEPQLWWCVCHYADRIPTTRLASRPRRIFFFLFVCFHFLSQRRRQTSTMYSYNILSLAASSSLWIFYFILFTFLQSIIFSISPSSGIWGSGALLESIPAVTQQWQIECHATWKQTTDKTKSQFTSHSCFWTLRANQRTYTE